MSIQAYATTTVSQIIYMDDQSKLLNTVAQPLL